MMRLRRPLYGVGDAFATEADDHFRKKRDAEVIYSTHDLFELFFWLSKNINEEDS